VKRISFPVTLVEITELIIIRIPAAVSMASPLVSLTGAFGLHGSSS